MLGAKGQISAEFSSVLAIQLLIIALLMVIFAGIMAQIGLRSEYVTARDSASLVSDTAKVVWNEGAGSMKRVRLSIPGNSMLSRSYIENNTIDIYLRSFGDISFAVPFPISGNWPSNPGDTDVEIINTGSQVVVRPAIYIEANLSVVYTALNKSDVGWSNTSIRLSNSMNTTYNATAGSNPCMGATITCIISPTSVQQITPGGYKDFSVFVNGSSSANGLYAGFVNFTLVPNVTGYPNGTNIIPITARVFS